MGDECYRRPMPHRRPATRETEDHRVVKRNEPCPCGSGKKFKRCHLLARPDGQSLHIIRKPVFGP